MATANQSLVDALKTRLGEPRRVPVEDLNFGLSDGTADQTFNLPYTESIDTTGIKIYVGQEIWNTCNTYEGFKEKLEITFTESTQVATSDTLLLTFTAGAPTVAGDFTVDLLDNAVTIVGGPQAVTAVGTEDATALAALAFAVLNPLLSADYTLTDNLDGTLTLVRVATGNVNTLSSAFVDTGTTGVTLGESFTAGVSLGDIAFDVLNNGTTIISGPVTVSTTAGDSASTVAQAVHDAITPDVTVTMSVSNAVLTFEAVDPATSDALTATLTDTDSTGITVTTELTEGIDRTDLGAYGATDKVTQIDSENGTVTFGDGTNGAIPVANTPLYAAYYDQKATFTDQQFDNLIVQAFKQAYLDVNLSTSYDSSTETLTLPGGGTGIKEEALILTFAELMTYKAAFHIDEFYLFRQNDLTIDTTKAGRLSIDYMEKVLKCAKKEAIRRYKQRKVGYYPVLTSAADIIADTVRSNDDFINLGNTEFASFFYRSSN
jgi:hypothetical protein